MAEVIQEALQDFFKTQHGESASVDAGSLENWYAGLPKILRFYELKNIWNAEETACFSSSSHAEVSCLKIKSLKVKLLSKTKWREKYFHSWFSTLEIFEESTFPFGILIYRQ